MVRYLISILGADCRTVDEYGNFPNHWAVRCGVGCSPLFVAAAVDQLEILQLLLSQVEGAHEDLQPTNLNGDAPLDIAFELGHFEIVYWLILNGALTDQDAGEDRGIRYNTVLDAFGPLEGWREDKRLTVLSWAKEALATQESAHASVTTEATLPATSCSRTLQHSEHKIRILRPLLAHLSASIADVPFFVDENGDYEYRFWRAEWGPPPPSSAARCCCREGTCQQEK